MADFVKSECKDGILTITLDNPKTLNALNYQLIRELDDAIDQASVSDARAVLITGSGKSFVAGADIKAMSVLSPAEAKAFGKLGASVFRKIELLPQPVIAVVNGFALGGGCELAMACDIRIASTKAKFGQPEVGLGITPGFSGTQRLSRLVGLGKAKELIFTGAIISAEQAHSIGLVDQLAEPDELGEKALELAQAIAKNSCTAVQYAKQAINYGYQTDIDSAIDMELSYFALCFADPDQKEGMNAFIEKRTPNFK